MLEDEFQVIITDAIERALTDAEWERWLNEHPDLAAEAAIARRVRAYILQLRAEQIAVPADFEAKLLARIRADTTLLQLLDLGLGGLARAVLEMLNALFGLLPASQTQSA